MRRPSWLVDVIVTGVLGVTALTAPFAVRAVQEMSSGRAPDTVTAVGAAQSPDAAAGTGQVRHRPGTGNTSDAQGSRAGRTPEGTAQEAGQTVERAARTGTGRALDPGTAPAPAQKGPHHAHPIIGPADNGWVHTWTAMPQLTEPGNMPPSPFNRNGVVFADSTLRQTVHVTLGGAQVRLHLSNVFGGAALPVTSVFVALPQGGRAGAGEIVAGTSRQVTFQGQKSVTIAAGQAAVSDLLDFTVQPGSDLTVTMYLSAGQASQNITSHPGSRTTSYMVTGDRSQDTALSGATTVEHWYFLSGVEVPAVQGTEQATVVLGDSLTDGRGSTTNGNDRWTDRLFDRFKADSATAGVAVLNQGAGGNRVLNDGLGPSARSRFDRDVLGPSGVTSVIIFEGINDIGTAAATQQAQTSVTNQLIAAYQEMIGKARARGLKVYGATLTPFGGNGYDDGGGQRETARQAINTWIRTSGSYDAVIDLDQAVRDAQQPRRLNSAYDTGDHLHMNPAGYAALAAAVPLGLFA